MAERRLQREREVDETLMRNGMDGGVSEDDEDDDEYDDDDDDDEDDEDGWVFVLVSVVL